MNNNKKMEQLVFEFNKPEEEFFEDEYINISPEDIPKEPEWTEEDYMRERHEPIPIDYDNPEVLAKLVRDSQWRDTIEKHTLPVRNADDDIIDVGRVQWRRDNSWWIDQGREKSLDREAIWRGI